MALDLRGSCSRRWDSVSTIDENLVTISPESAVGSLLTFGGGAGAAASLPEEVGGEGDFEAVGVKTVGVGADEGGVEEPGAVGVKTVGGRSPPTRAGAVGVNMVGAAPPPLAAAGLKTAGGEGKTEIAPPLDPGPAEKLGDGAGADPEGEEVGGAKGPVGKAEAPVCKEV